MVNSETIDPDRLNELIKNAPEIIPILLNAVDVKRSPEQLGIEIGNGRSKIYFGGITRPYVDPKKFAGLDEIVNNLSNKIDETINKRGILILYGPHGSGKSIVIRELLAEKLIKGDLDFVVELSSENMRRFAFLLEGAEIMKFEKDFRDITFYGPSGAYELYSKIVKDTKTLIFYDPLPPFVYEESESGGPVDIVEPGIVKYTERLISIANDSRRKSEYGNIPIIVVLPSPLYNILSKNTKKEVRAIEVNLSSNKEFLKELILMYSGTGRKYATKEYENLVDNLVNYISQYNEGRVLMASLLGKKLRIINYDLKWEMEKIVKGVNAEKTFTEALEDAASRMGYVVMGYLGILNSDGYIDIKKLGPYSRIISERELHKDKYETGQFIKDPKYLSTLFSEASRAGLDDEGVMYLAQKLGNLTEMALTRISGAIRGNKCGGEYCEYWEKVLEPWKVVADMYHR
ncbi:MAG: hypothetical protein ACP5IB_10050 [Thermoplasmata archaeon]